MLRIHSDAVALIRELREIVAGIERKDRNLGDQLRRSLNSVGANISEGAYAQGRKRHCHYFIAMASASEARTHLEIAEAWGYCGPVSFEVSERFARIIGSLHRIVV